jgi:serine/threonine protein kinase
MHERDVMAMIDHPFVLKLIATMKDKDCLYMVMELVQGGELFALLANQQTGCLSVESTRFYAACVIAGLEAMHDKNIVYRDLKPEK